MSLSSPEVLTDRKIVVSSITIRMFDVGLAYDPINGKHTRLTPWSDFQQHLDCVCRAHMCAEFFSIAEEIAPAGPDSEDKIHMVIKSPFCSSVIRLLNMKGRTVRDAIKKASKGGIDISFEFAIQGTHIQATEYVNDNHVFNEDGSVD